MPFADCRLRNTVSHKIDLILGHGRMIAAVDFYGDFGHFVSILDQSIEVNNLLQRSILIRKVK